MLSLPSYIDTVTKLHGSMHQRFLHWRFTKIHLAKFTQPWPMINFPLGINSIVRFQLNKEFFEQFMLKNIFLLPSYNSNNEEDVNVTLLFKKNILPNNQFQKIWVLLYIIHWHLSQAFLPWCLVFFLLFTATWEYSVE